LREKFDLYQRGGVREYLAVNPVGNYLHRFRRGEDDAFGPAELFTADGLLSQTARPGVEIPLWENFGPPAPDQPHRGGERAGGMAVRVLGSFAIRRAKPAGLE
jgi:hypothetical protein